MKTLSKVCRDTWPSSRCGSLKHRHKHISCRLRVASALLWEPFKGSSIRWITVPWLKLLLETRKYVAMQLKLNYSHCWLIIWQFCQLDGLVVLIYRLSEDKQKTSQSQTWRCFKLLVLPDHELKLQRHSFSYHIQNKKQRTLSFEKLKAENVCFYLDSGD